MGGPSDPWHRRQAPDPEPELGSVIAYILDVDLGNFGWRVGSAASSTKDSLRPLCSLLISAVSREAAGLEKHTIQ